MNNWCERIFIFSSAQTDLYLNNEVLFLPIDKLAGDVSCWWSSLWEAGIALHYYWKYNFWGKQFGKMYKNFNLYMFFNWAMFRNLF